MAQQLFDRCMNKYEVLRNPLERWTQTNHFKQFSVTIIQFVRK